MDKKGNDYLLPKGSEISLIKALVRSNSKLHPFADETIDVFKKEVFVIRKGLDTIQIDTADELLCLINELRDVFAGHQKELGHE